MKTKKKKIYFAHSVKWWKTKREERIIEILESRGFEVVNPFASEREVNEKYKAEQYYAKPSLPYANDITDKDYSLVKSCDELFAWFPKDTTVIGTPIEMMKAIEWKKKVSVLYCKPHPFLWSDLLGVHVFYLGYDNFKNNIIFHEREYRNDNI